MIMEPVANGNLAEFIHDLADGDRDSERLDSIPKWFGCLASGMAYLHAKNIHHRDVKSQNILYMNQIVLFTDFGIAREFEEQTRTGSTTVTRNRDY